METSESARGIEARKDPWPTVAMLVSLLVLISAAGPAFSDPGSQEDFFAIYTAAFWHKLGLDPYNTVLLSRVTHNPALLPYAYPPYTLCVFRPLTCFNFATAARLFLALKCLSAGLLLCIWNRLIPLQKHRGVLWILIPLAFNGAILIDLSRGNISIFEQLLIWTGFYCYTRGRMAAFAAAVVLAGSFKWLPLVLLGLLLARGQKRQIVVGVAAGLLALAGIGCGCLASPDLSQSFLRNARQMALERGSINPCSWAWIQDTLSPWDRVTGAVVPPFFSYACYGVMIAAMAFVGIWLFWRLKDRDDPDGHLWRMSLLCLIYAVIVPRFKDYSYILLVPPALFILASRPLGPAWLPWAFVLAMDRMGGGYKCLLLAWALLALCAYCIWEETKPAAAAKRNATVSGGRSPTSEPPPTPIRGE